MKPSDEATDRHFLGRAVALAHANIRDSKGGPFGAVIVENGRVVAEGSNQVVATCDPSAHAEVVAIRKAALEKGSPHLEGCTLYSSCEPCPMCLATAYWAHISRIVYAQGREDAQAMGFSDADIYGQIALEPGRRSIRCEQLRLQSGDDLAEAWNSSAGRRPY